MENKYITVAYKLYAVTDGEKELREEALQAIRSSSSQESVILWNASKRKSWH